MVNFELLKSGLRYLSEIFSICSSHVCANLMKKILPLLNLPARNDPLLPEFWTALATIVVEIFFDPMSLREHFDPRNTSTPGAFLDGH